LGKVEEGLGKVLVRGIEAWWPEEGDRRWAVVGLLGSVWREKNERMGGFGSEDRHGWRKRR
jgi:hypothetical protein